MTQVDIISGFLGAGKTTLIKKLLKEAINNQKTILIENEFGEIGIDGGFLKDAGIEIREMNSGCICCTLVGDFEASLKEVLEKYHPDRIIIEPSGVGKLSDVIRAVRVLDGEKDVCLNSATVVVDAMKVKMYMKNFGEFYNDQIEHAGAIILSRTGNIKSEKLEKAIELLRSINTNAQIITTPWEQLEGSRMLEVMEGHGLDLASQLMEEVEDHDHHHHEDHEHHDHHEHHHDHGEECSCGCHDHDHHHDHEHSHHHHHADDIFTSWGFETAKVFTEEELTDMLTKLSDDETYGAVLRAKGLVASNEEGTWFYFDYVPGEYELRKGKPDVTGKLCVIGSKINEDKLKELFA